MRCKHLKYILCKHLFLKKDAPRLFRAHKKHQNSNRFAPLKPFCSASGERGNVRHCFWLKDNRVTTKGLLPSLLLFFLHKTVAKHDFKSKLVRTKIVWSTYQALYSSPKGKGHRKSPLILNLTVAKKTNNLPNPTMDGASMRTMRSCFFSGKKDCSTVRLCLDRKLQNRKKFVLAKLRIPQ